MKITSKNPIDLVLNRKGGCVITSRLDFWVATNTGWQWADSLIFQNVSLAAEKQTITLPHGTYTVLARYTVEESINGVYKFETLINNQSSGVKSGDVNTTSNSHDLIKIKDQFSLEVE